MVAVSHASEKCNFFNVHVTLKTFLNDNEDIPHVSVSTFICAFKEMTIVIVKPNLNLTLQCHMAQRVDTKTLGVCALDCQPDVVDK